MKLMKKFRRFGADRLTRKTDLLIPLAFLISALIGHWEGAKAVHKYMLVSRALALGSAVGLRCAVSAQPSMRMARGSAQLSMLLQPLGGIALILLLKLRGALSPYSAMTTLAAVGLNVEAVCYEYLLAAGEEPSAGMLRVVTAVLLFGGVLMTAPPALPIALTIACLTAMAVGLVAAVTIGNALGRAKFNDEVLKAAPRALLYCGLYPLIWLILRRVPGTFVAESPTFTPFFVGLIPWILWRTPFRRSAAEARPMNRAACVTLAVCAVVILLCATHILPAFPPELPASAVMVAVATLCALAVFSRIEWPKRSEEV